MFVDYHMHTAHSVDSRVAMRHLCDRAVELGLDEIAVTDHLDYNQADPGCGLYDVDAWFDDYAQTTPAFADRLTVRAGIEIGEPHLYADRLEPLLARPFDVVIGSIHYVGPYGVHEDVFDKLPLDEALTAYFDAQAEMARSGLIDVLAHLDYFQRYTLQRGMPPFEPERWERPIRDALQAVIASDIALEVNTSGVRQQPGVTFPGETILTWYHEMGGRAITVGSDAHELDHLAADIPETLTTLRRIGFATQCVFEDRQRSIIPIES